MSSRHLLSVLTATTALLAAVPAAHADYFNGEPVDSSGAVVSVGDVDVARDGSGAVGYVRQDGGINHVFVSRLVNGVWQAPERVDAGLAGAGSQPVVAASDGGRVTVAYVSGGQLFAALRPAGAPSFTAPQAIGQDASNPSIDMSITGSAYVSFTSGGDVRVARLPRDGQTFNLLPDVVDINQPATAGTGTGRSEVAVSADGTAVIVWGENGHVYGRRVFFDRLSTAPQDLNVPTLDGHSGGAADNPSIDIEDDSSFAWATFRQQFDDGRYHLVAKRLVGSLFEQETRVDAIDFGSGDDAVSGFIDMSGRGEGFAATSTASHTPQVSILHDNKFFPAVNVDGAGGADPHVVGGTAENTFLYVFWLTGTTNLTAAVRATSYKVDAAKRTVPGPEPARTLSDPVVDANAGFDAAVNRAGDAVATYVARGTLFSAGFDRVPGNFRTYTTVNYRKFARPPLAWQPSFELWGPPTYHVIVDGQEVGTTTDTKFTPPVAIPDGEHRWKVVATDRRGQSYTAPERVLRVDATPPEVTFSVSGVKKKGRKLRVKVTAADGSIDSPAGSGIKVVRVNFGDGAKVEGRDVTHAYGKGGTFTIAVTAADKAGNATVVRRQIRVKKK